LTIEASIDTNAGVWKRFFGLVTDEDDPGDVDDGEEKRRARGLRVDDRVLWREHGMRGTVIAIMVPHAVDASEVWIRWDKGARPGVYKPHATSRFEVLS
jgi:hypothetical protein